jgi:hypothetical protein
MSSTPPSPTLLAVDDAVRFRAILAISCASVSLLVGALCVYIYYFHPQHRVHLRSQFNNVLLVAITLLTCQTAPRIVSSAALLGDFMTPVLCDVCGGIDVFLTSASLMCVVGFYYTIMALRYNPIRFLTVRLMGLAPSAYELANRYFWYAVALVYASTLTGVSISVLFKRMDNNNATVAVESSRKSLFDVSLGYCSIQRDSDMGNTYFLVSAAIPTSLLMLMSVLSYLAIRHSVLQLRTISWNQSWPIYVRFFSINFFLLFMMGFGIYADSSDTPTPVVLAFFAATTPLWCGWIGLCFLVSEGIVGQFLFHERDSRVGASGSGAFAAQDAAVKPQRRGRLPSELDEPLTGRSLAADLQDTESRLTRASGTTDTPLTTSQALSSTQSTLGRSEKQRKRRAAAQRKAVNGFTICMQSLLVLEVEGIVFVQTNLDLLLQEQDMLLAGGRRGGSVARKSRVVVGAHHTAASPSVTQQPETEFSLNGDGHGDEVDSPDEEESR